MGFPGGSRVKNPSAMKELQETWVQFLGREDPLEEGMVTYSGILAWKNPKDRRSCQITVHEVAELNMTE